MHEPQDTERLASYADVLADELPGTWGSTYYFPDNWSGLTKLTGRIWDLDLAAQLLAEHPLRHAAVLTRSDGAQLAVMDRHDGQNGFLIAAVAPRSLPDEAYRGVREPNGIAVADDPFLAAGQICGDLLARYETALAQARRNAAPDIPPSRPDQVVLAWQDNGSLSAAPVGETAAAILTANGFVQDPQTGTYLLAGDDTATQARAVYRIGQQLGAHEITVALHHSSGRSTPTTAAPTPSAPAPLRTTKAR